MGRERLIETFSKLVAIDSVSKNEGKVHEYLIQTFESLGLEVIEDQSKKQTGLGGNNIIATHYGTKKVKPLFFSSHTDTVTPGEGIEAIEKEGIIYSKGETILAADDKAGIAIMIESIQQILDEGLETGVLEFVLSPGEEIGLVGAEALDIHLLESDIGYVLDNGGPVGKAIVASPTLYMYDVTIHGKAAHAGLEPEKGISAVQILTEALHHIKVGRLDDETTANIGQIHGGTATNVVMDYLELKGEVRSISKEKADQLIQEMKTSFETAAKAFGGTVAINVDLKATGFRLSEEEPVIELFKKAVKAVGREYTSEVSGGGSDANVFNAKGKRVANVSIGYDKIHTVDEYIPVVEMEKAVELVLALVKESPKKE